MRRRRRTLREHLVTIALITIMLAVTLGVLLVVAGLSWTLIHTLPQPLAAPLGLGIAFGMIVFGFWAASLVKKQHQWLIMLALGLFSMLSPFLMRALLGSWDAKAYIVSRTPFWITVEHFGVAAFALGTFLVVWAVGWHFRSRSQERKKPS